MSVSNICAILDLALFTHKNFSSIRELGWIEITDERPLNVQVHPGTLPLHDQAALRTFRYVKYQVHGLDFYPSTTTGYLHNSDIRHLVKSLYDSAASQVEDVVAYKGGCAEKKLLDELQIPSVNLDDVGVPVFQRSSDADYYKQFSCDNHRNYVHGWLNCTSCQVMFYRDCVVECY